MIRKVILCLFIIIWTVVAVAQTGQTEKKEWLVISYPNGSFTMNADSVQVCKSSILVYASDRWGNVTCWPFYNSINAHSISRSVIMRSKLTGAMGVVPAGKQAKVEKINKEFFIKSYFSFPQYPTNAEPIVIKLDKN